MLENLNTIQKALLQHRTIRQQIEQVGDSVNDLEAFIELQKTYSDWAQSSVAVLSEKLKVIKRVIASLNSGLQKHFGFEEKAFPPIFGEMLMKAILLEHNEIKQQLIKANEAANVSLEGMTQESVLIKKVHLQQALGALSKMIEEHASGENMILEKIQRALEAERGVKNGA